MDVGTVYRIAATALGGGVYTSGHGPGNLFADHSSPMLDLGPLERILDSDGDGNLSNEMTRLGGGLLRRLFSRRR